MRKLRSRGFAPSGPDARSVSRAAPCSSAMGPARLWVSLHEFGLLLVDLEARRLATGSDRVDGSRAISNLPVGLAAKQCSRSGPSLDDHSVAWGKLACVALDSGLGTNA